jgi:hypothetical protein
MNIKDLVNKRISKNVKFMGEDVKISKLNTSEVLSIQEAAKDLTEESEDGLLILRKVIRSSVEGAEILSDADFLTFPMDELSKLSNEIMAFSGFKDQEKGK